MKEWVAANPAAAVDLLIALLALLGVGIPAMAALLKYAKITRAVSTTLVDALERGKQVGSPAIAVIDRLKTTEMPNSRAKFLSDVVAAVKGRPRENIAKRLGNVAVSGLLGWAVKKLK